LKAFESPFKGLSKHFKGRSNAPKDLQMAFESPFKDPLTSF
jgi:hypothetical protein